MTGGKATKHIVETIAKSNISYMRSRCHRSSSFHNGLYVCKGHPGTGKGRGD